MTTVASRIALLALMAITLGIGTASQAEDKCQACVQEQTADCVRRVSSPPPSAGGKSTPPPVEASGVSACRQSAQNSCKAAGAC